VQVGYNIFLVLGLIVGIVFSVLVFASGKGDAMSGGSGVRTTFKGKANFEDIISRITLILGASFMALMLLVDLMSNHLHAASTAPTTTHSAPKK
jgi:preprotein translocase subunit SecG